jgi:predicted RNase H-like nuclease (RuvC/YqgF family)
MSNISNLKNTSNKLYKYDKTEISLLLNYLLFSNKDINQKYIKQSIKIEEQNNEFKFILEELKIVKYKVKELEYKVKELEYKVQELEDKVQELEDKKQKIKFICECGCEIDKCYLYKHIKTKKHLNLLENKIKILK